MRSLTVVFFSLGILIGVVVSSNILFVQGTIGEIEMLLLCVAAILLFTVVMVLTLNARVTVEGAIFVSSSFTQVCIPFDAVTDVEFRQTFSPGLKIAGYGSLHRHTGVYSNKEFKRYRIAVDTRIAGFIIVKYGQNDVLVFNSVDGQTTYSMFTSIQSALKERQ